MLRRLNSSEHFYFLLFKFDCNLAKMHLIDHALAYLGTTFDIF